MAYYAKISNQEFTVSERARLSEARQEKDVIENDNRASDGYIALNNMYRTKNTSDTLESLQAERNALYADRENPPAQEDVDSLNASIQAEKDTLAEEATELLEQMEILEEEGTEDLVAEIETLNTTIANALCRVTDMYTGTDEIVMVAGESSNIQVPIQAKLEEIAAVPEVEFDNSVYWEGFYGGCKRTSYNTQGGVHKLGGTPFRKNYAWVGYIYDPVRDAFYTEQPYASWTLNEDACYWEPPTPRPEGMDWYWKEDTTEWVDYYWQAPTSEQPYPSWTYDGVDWMPPVPHPDSMGWKWNEETQKWIKEDGNN